MEYMMKNTTLKNHVSGICRENLPSYDWLGLMFEVFFAFLFQMFGEMTYQQPSSGFPKEHREELLKFVPWLRKAQVTWMRRSRLFAFFDMIGPLGLFVYCVFTIVCIRVFILECIVNMHWYVAQYATKQ